MKSIAILTALLWVSPAFADDDDADTKPASKAEDEKTGEHEKSGEPEGGKFSLLSHECKAEQDELETVPGSPPLDVDDPATPGCNAWEVNIVTSGEFGKHQSWETPLLDINYGIGDNLQLKLEAPYEIAKTDAGYESGVGAAEVGLKVRFYENEESGLTVAAYPQIEFAIPGTALADTEEGSGTLTKLPLLVSKKIGATSKGDIMVTGNIGYNISTRTGTEHYLSAAFGVGMPLLSSVAVMLEGSTEQALSNNMDGVREHYYKANLGLMGKINPHLMVFGSVGQTFASSDAEDSSHTCALLGFRVIAGGP
jgi:hypothetical protein